MCIVYLNTSSKPIDEKTNKMDFMVKHMAGLPRRLNAAPPIDSIGFLPEKRDIVDMVFGSWNYSFILKGEGFYDLDGVRYPVRAPAVLTQWPGQPMHYGPDGTWQELYLIYPAACGERLKALGLIPTDRPCWQVGNPRRLWELAGEFEALAAAPDLEANTDRLDFMALRLVLESLLEEKLAIPGRLEPEIRTLAGRIRQNPELPFDWEAEAEKLGISLTSLRRFFHTYLGTPAGEYLQSARIGRARRMLVETALPIAEIARRCGFADPFYFSRRFRAETGETASSYRFNHRVNS